MTTQFVGIKEFRANMAVLSEAAVRQHRRLIILRKNKPLFELRPLDQKEASLESLLQGVTEAREDARRGRTYSAAQIRKELGL
jgi:PHD/YefM family antitoxin component YafN of YafNO toxin-antitoxin module